MKYFELLSYHGKMKNKKENDLFVNKIYLITFFLHIYVLRYWIAMLGSENKFSCALTLKKNGFRNTVLI